MAVRSHTLKVTGVSDELVRLLDDRVKERRILGRSEYIRELIRNDVLDQPRTLRGILASIHAANRDLGEGEERLDDFFDEVRREVFQESQVQSA